jgi:hypothetical protein
MTVAGIAGCGAKAALTNSDVIAETPMIMAIPRHVFRLLVVIGFLLPISHQHA